MIAPSAIADFSTFSVLSLAWASRWSALTGYALDVYHIVDRVAAISFEQVSVVYPGDPEPSWHMKSIHDGVEVSSAEDGWREGHLFSSLQAALQAICGLTEAQRQDANRAGSSGLRLGAAFGG